MFIRIKKLLADIFYDLKSHNTQNINVILVFRKFNSGFMGINESITGTSVRRR